VRASGRSSGVFTPLGEAAVDRDCVALGPDELDADAEELCLDGVDERCCG
jgi:hypothetical protein